MCLEIKNTLAVGLNVPGGEEVEERPHTQFHRDDIQVEGLNVSGGEERKGRNRTQFHEMMLQQPD